MIQISGNLSVFCDGGSRGNPGPGACAFIVKNRSDSILHEEGKYLGTVTNNIAEYNGVYLALLYLKNNFNFEKGQKSQINIFLDSNLVVSQLNGLFKVKNSNLREIIVKIQSLLSRIKTPIVFSHVPREENYHADLLLNKILDQHLL